LDWRERERILLDEAAAVSADACRTLETTNLPAMIVDQIQMQIDALRAATLHLTDHAHDVVFVGPVGSGKSTLLSVLAGLTLAEDEISEAGGSRLERRSVLASSAGRTSV
jgi:predicted ABC-type transport system involved in lysophospholipase L1 biosynthesis ATPase subunit